MSSRARVFDPIASIALAGGPMKTIPASSQAAREGRVLGQEAVAGVHASAPACARDLEDLLDAQVALGRGAGPRRYASPARRTCGASRSISE